MRLPSLIAATLLVLATASPSTATVYHVCPDGSGDTTTIGAAVAMAAPGDGIALCPGVYTVHSVVLPPGVSMWSESDNAADTIIDAAFQGRCLVQPAGGAGDITALTLRNGVHASEGGLVLAAGSDAVYRRCVFEGGSAPRGGAVRITTIEPHTADFIDCVFEGNEATSGDGGAIDTEYFVSLAGCVFRDNSATGYGGAVNHGDPAGSGFEIHDCTFESNTAGQGGGAIYTPGSVMVVNGSSLYGSTFAGNHALYGGALMFDGDSPAAASIGGNRFLDNFAGLWGGAIFINEWEQPKDGYPFTDCVFGRNSAGEAGGAIMALNGLELDHCTFVENSSLQGGQIYSDPDLQLDACIVAFAPFGGAVRGNGSAFLSCTDIHGNGGGDWTGLLAGQDAVDGNFSLDPLFCDAADSDYTLRSNSPCAAPGVTACGLIGAEDVGCGPVSVREETWARIKAGYRVGGAAR